MSQLVFLVEEPSMAEALKGVLPRLLPESVAWKCVPHEGRSDLERSIPRKLRAWREVGVRFVVLRDNDGGDCHLRKQALLELCRQGERHDTLVRIICQNLESWVLGDLRALDTAGLGGGNLASRQNQRKFRKPDALANAIGEIRRLAPEYRKVSGARRVGPHLSVEPDRNRSPSYNAFLRGVLRTVRNMQESETASPD